MEKRKRRRKRETAQMMKEKLEGGRMSGGMKGERKRGNNKELGEHCRQGG